MTTTLELTERQQQVLDLLRQDVPVREIGDRLGTSRNAVYQNINTLKKKGALPPNFKQTASGDTESPSRKLLSDLTNGTETDGNTHKDVPTPAAGYRPASEPAQRPEENGPLSAELLRELATVQQELAVMANRLSRYL